LGLFPGFAATWRMIKDTYTSQLHLGQGVMDKQGA
jgi:hypothetical protein